MKTLGILAATLLISSPSFAIPFSQLPQEIQEKTKYSLQSYLGNDLSSFDFEPLDGGFSGTPLYKITDEEKVMVMRVLCDNFVCKRRVVTLSNLGAEYTLSPKVYFPSNMLTPSSIMLSDYVEGTKPSLETFDDYQHLLAKRLRKMHDTDIKGLPIAKDSFRKIDHYLGQSAQAQLFAPELALIDRIQTSILRASPEYTMTHMDLNLNNIIQQGDSFQFIDWADGGLGDPMADIATLTVEFGLTDDEAIDFLTNYLRKAPNAAQEAHLMLLRRVKYFDLVAFALMQINQSGHTYVSNEDPNTFKLMVQDIHAGRMVLEEPSDWTEVLDTALNEFRKNPEQYVVWMQELLYQ